MHKQFCDNCNCELKTLDEYTSKQSVKIIVKIKSARREIPAETRVDFCSAACTINWFMNNQKKYHQNGDTK
jgi:hypothetical protein